MKGIQRELNEFQRGLHEAWLKDRLKGFSAQSDIDHQELKRLRAENELLRKGLDVAEQLYNEAGKDREVLISKVQDLRKELINNPRPVNTSALQKKHDTLRIDTKKLIQLQKAFMVDYSARSKREYEDFKKQFKEKHGL
jgi:hypothetical protein